MKKEVLILHSGKILKKKDLDKFLNKLSKYGEIYAPVKTDTVRFQKVKSAKEICFDEHAWFPPKRFLFPQKHILFEYDKNGIKKRVGDVEPIVLFGLRNCDLNAFLINDKLFLNEKHPDPQYKKRRENILLIGLYCFEEMDKYCFCSSMELKDYYDIMLYDRGKYFHVKAGSEKGKRFLVGLKDDNFNPQPTRCSTKLNNKDIRKFFTDKRWEEGADDCTSCGQCTNLCPTCLCFDIEEETELDGSGKRVAQWDSCMYKDFTKVAGNHVFREKRIDRFKHRIYHKLQYFKDAFGMYMCTGCGRCIRGCPAKIDWIKIVNSMKK